MRGLESFLLYGVVREETDEHFVPARCDWRRLLGAAVPSQAGRLSIASVIDLDVVVRTL